MVIAPAAVAVLSAWRANQQLHPKRTTGGSYDLSAELASSEAVAFTSSDGIPLAGTFVAPRNGAVVVLAHGLAADRVQLLGEAQLLVEHGYGILLFDERAHGASGGSLSTWGYLESGDVERAVDFIGQRTQLSVGQIGLLGFSIGGTAVVRAAIGDPRIGAVIVEADFGSVADEFRYMFQRYGPLSQLPALWAIQASGLDLAALEPDRMLRSLHPRPLLLVYGSHDSSVPATEALRMARSAGPLSSLLMIDTAEHGGFIRTATAQYSERLISFLDTSLLRRGSGRGILF
ncbi:MAG: alpha/beta hydrolase [Chloroflexota bacterium]